MNRDDPHAAVCYACKRQPSVSGHAPGCRLAPEKPWAARSCPSESHAYCTAWLGLAWRLARRAALRACGGDTRHPQLFPLTEHLGAEACMALVNSGAGFDPGRGLSFGTYAGTAIARRLWRAAALFLQGSQVQSLDFSAEEDGFRPREPACHGDGPPEAAQRAEARGRVRELLRVLGPRQRAVLLATVGLGDTLTATGKRYGVGKERARQIRNRALQRLRRAAGVAP